MVWGTHGRDAPEASGDNQPSLRALCPTGPGSDRGSNSPVWSQAVMSPAKFDYVGRPAFPGKPRNADAWNRFWSELLAAPRVDRNLPFNPATGGESIPHHGLRMDVLDFAYHRQVHLYRDLGLHRVLLAGNGISALPLLIAHLGFEVTAVDISSVATAYASSHPLELPFLVRFCIGTAMTTPDEMAKAQPMVAEAYRPGGRAEFQVADLFASALNPATLDLIIAQHVVGHLSVADRAEMAERFFTWLRPGGVLEIEEDHDYWLRHIDVRPEQSIEEPFEEAGFIHYQKEAYLWLRERKEVSRWWHRWRLGPEGSPTRREFETRLLRSAQVDIESTKCGAKLAIFRTSR